MNLPVRYHDKKAKNRSVSLGSFVWTAAGKMLSRFRVGVSTPVNFRNSHTDVPVS